MEESSSGMKNSNVSQCSQRSSFRMFRQFQFQLPLHCNHRMWKKTWNSYRFGIFMMNVPLSHTATLQILQFKHRFSANAIIRDAGVLLQLNVFFYLRIQEKERKTQTSVQFTTASNNIYYCNSSIEQSKKTINLRSYHLCALFLCALDFINSFSERGKNAQHTECIVLCKSTKCSNRVSYFCQLRSIYLFMMTKMNAKGNSRPIQHTQSITS